MARGKGERCPWSKRVFVSLRAAWRSGCGVGSGAAGRGEDEGEVCWVGDEGGGGVLDIWMSSSSSSGASGFEGENLMAVRRRRLVILSLKTKSS